MTLIKVAFMTGLLAVSILGPTVAPGEQVGPLPPQSVTLAWSPSPDSSVTGYMIYFGDISSAQTNKLDAGSATNAAVPNLQSGVTYFFYATAYDALGMESQPSNLITYTPIAKQPDLVITSLSFSPSVPTGGDPVLFQATVRNQGAAATPQGINVRVSFAVDAAPAVAWGNLSNALAVGATVTITGAGTWSALTGVHSITATVDDLNALAEAGETNNQYQVQITVATPPAITTQPLSQTVTTGQNVGFSSVAVGTAPLSYQWLYNGTALSGATSSSLMLNNVQTTDAGNYTVVVTNVAGRLTSAVGKLTVTVTPVNHAPVASPDTYTILEDAPLTIPAAGILANDADMDGDALTALLVSNVTHGNLSLGANGSFTYVPTPSYSGSDSFTYRAHDGTTTGNLALVTINLSPVNDLPLAVNDSTNTLEDMSVTIKVLANDSDPDGTPLTLTGTATTNGTAVISGPNVIFRAATNFNGPVVFSYTVSDGTNSATANVAVTVTPVNDAPLARNDTYTTLKDVPLTIAAPGLLANDVDVDGNSLITFLVSGVTHGNLSLGTNGGFTYTPNTNHNGGGSFTYRATDGLTIGNIVTVTINVTPVNRSPVAVSDSTNTLENVSATIKVLGNDSDPDGTPLTLTATATTNGTAVISGPNIVFTPALNFTGVLAFSYTVSDGTNLATANVTVTVTPVNDTPLSLGSAELTGDGFSFQFPSTAGSTYVIEATTNMTDWVPIFTNTALTGQVVFTDPTAVSHASRFYRVIAR